jgi:hypothetical protein
MNEPQTQNQMMPSAPGSSTAKQRGLIRRLAGERVLDDAQRAFCAGGAVDRLGMSQASRVIGELLKLRTVASVPAGGVDALASSLPDVPAGRYAIETDEVTKFYEVDRPTEGKYAGWVFVSVRASDERHPIKQLAAKHAILEVIAADPRAASELFGKKLGRCGICGRSLTDEDSRARGIGPVCAAARGWA